MSKYTYTMGRELDLQKEQESTLATPVLKANLFLKMFYLSADILYGTKINLPKAKVLEILARYPYWAWENGGYYRLTRLYARTKKSSDPKRQLYLHYVEIGREAQDNEQMHLFLFDDIIHQKKIKLGWFRHWLFPRLAGLGYYYFSRLLFYFRPTWSFAMNAAFESHAEHEYMKLAKNHPEWEDESVDSVHFEHYPRQKSLADLVRRVALDERDHMHHSLEAIEKLRGAKPHQDESDEKPEEKG